MTDFTDYTENWIMNWFRGTTAPAAPANVYVALFSSDPTETGTAGTEVTTIIRPAGRLAIGFAAISSGKITNVAEINFGTSAGDATVSHMALFDAASAGNMLIRKTLGASFVAVAGGPVVIQASAISLSVN